MTTPADAPVLPDPAPGWRLGSFRGVPVYLGRTWLLVALVIVLGFAPAISAARPDLGGWSVAVAVAYVLLLLLSVLAHEAGHAVAAQAFGHRVHRIVADLWGGHTTYQAGTNTPGRSALVAAAGPAMNALLAGAAWLVLPHLPYDGVVALLVGALFYSNAFVAVFNLLPGLPLDGGFLVDSFVWKVTGSRVRGQLVAGWTGRAVTVAVVLWFVVVPLLRGRQPSLFSTMWMVLIAFFLWQGASAAVRNATAQARLASVPANDVVRPVAPLRAGESIAEALARIAATAPGTEPLPVVFDDGGRPLGVVSSAWQEIPAEARVTTPVGAALLVVPDIPVVPWRDDLTAHDLVDAMTPAQTPMALVHDPRWGYGAVLAQDLADRLDA